MATRVARYAQRIGIKESGSNLAVVLVAAYLREIGAPDSQRKHGRVSPELLAQESPTAARAILEKLGSPVKMIDQVCEIIGQQHEAGASQSLNGCIIHDATLIADLEDKRKQSRMSAEELEAALTSGLTTRAGKEEAEAVLSG